MRNDLSDEDVLTFTLAGCNAAEIAAFAGVSEPVALARMNRALRDHASRRVPQTVLVLAEAQA